jgi:CBS domain containing-hemolysin-like protein
MIQVILLILAILAIVYTVLLLRSFEYMSVGELKRQARAGNPYAKKVYPVRAYKMQLWIVLWTLIGFLMSSIVLLLDNLMGALLTILINIPLVILIHAVLPWAKRPKPSLKMAALVSPFFERLLRLLYPALSRVEKWIGNWIQPEPILLIQSKDELLEILRHNAEEFDHINSDELKIAENALIFGDKAVSDFMIPLNTVHFVSKEEQLTPKVMDELHKSGYSRFPVFQGNRQNVVGTLFIKDAISLSNQRYVKDVMKPEVYYINEQQNLDYALMAFIKTKHHLFIVVNQFEDIVGVISIEDILEQIVGKPIMDEFDQFEDLRAVAKVTADKVHESREPENV